MAITDTHKEVSKLLKEQRKFHKAQKGENYPDEHGVSSDYNFAEEDLEKILSGKLTPLYATNIFEGLARWYLDNVQYEILEHNDTEKATLYYARATAYAYLTIALFVSESKCENAGDGGLWYDNITEFTSRSLIAGWEAEYVQMTEWIYEAIDYGRSQIPTGGVDELFFGTGSELCETSWFLLDLYAKAYGREYNRAHAERPEKMIPYDTVLQAWDTTDMKKVDQLVYLLCEHHVMQTEEATSEEDYFAFSAFYELYPYEILSWLKLREKKGLPNPKSFPHPLMNTPIAKFFLQLKTPLERPRQLPYVEPLLDAFKTVCSNVEVAPWIEAIKKGSDDLLPEDFLEE